MSVRSYIYLFLYELQIEKTWTLQSVNFAVFNDYFPIQNVFLWRYMLGFLYIQLFLYMS